MTLDASIELLTREHKTAAHTIDGLEFHTRPPLLHLLREAIFGGMESTGGSSMKAKLPISESALDLYELIDRQITEASFGFGEHGGMVGFVTEDNRVRLRINLEAARAAGLTISSKLLRVAAQKTPQQPQQPAPARTITKRPSKRPRSPEDSLVELANQ